MHTCRAARQGDPVCRNFVKVAFGRALVSRLVLRFPAHISIALKQTADYHRLSEFFPTSWKVWPTCVGRGSPDLPLTPSLVVKAFTYAHRERDRSPHRLERWRHFRPRPADPT